MTARGLRLLRRVLGALLLVGLVYVTWLVAGVKRHVPVEVEQQVADLPQGGEEYGVSEGLVLDWDGGSFRHLEAGRATKDADGTFTLENGLEILVERGEGQGPLVVKARGGRLPESESARVVVSGEVEVTGEGGFLLESEELELDRSRQKIHSSKPVTFAQGDLRGEAGTLIHDWSTKETLLSVAPVLRLVSGRTGGREVTVRGADLRLDEKTRRLEARGDARIDLPEGAMTAASLDVVLDAGSDEVRRITSVGNAVTTTRAPGPGGGSVTRTLRGSTIVHAFSGASRLEEVIATGAAELVAPGPGAEPAELVRGDVLRLAFRGGATTRPERVTASGAPAHAEIQDGPRRQNVTAASIDGQFDARGALSRVVAHGSASTTTVDAATERRLVAERTTLSFDEGARVEAVEFEGGPARMVERTKGPRGVEERTVVASSGAVQVDGAGEVRAGHLEGGVRLGKPGFTATGDTATVDEASGKTVLRLNASVETEGRTSHGEEVVYDPKGQQVVVRGGQHTIVRDAKKAGGLGDLVKGDEPIYISSDELVVHEAERRAVYSGARPSLRRGDSEIVADVLRFDDAKGTMLAEGDVDSKLRIATEARPGGSSGLFDPTRLVVGESATVSFDREERLVVYGGGVRLVQGQSELTAREVRIHLAGEGGRVERLEATGEARFKSPEWEAEGHVIDYSAPDARVKVLAGKRPAKARDGAGHWATGEALEKLIGSDGWRVVAPAGGRTRGGAPAAESSGADPQGSRSQGAVPNAARKVP